ncbi:hypothetical protein N7G274_002951 [Stereocaulon virgatum]|uniref:Uncharacterized protein n=1 Tax=Stereocaulon virgatum TaxID=373712 RepID=A0ABR4AFE8_9LECA
MAQPTLALSTSMNSAEYMSAGANGLELVKKMLVSPSTWHSGSVGPNAGCNVSIQQLASDLPDPGLLHSGASFAWPVNPTSLPSSSFGVAQSMNEPWSSYANEWLGQRDGLIGMDS